MKKVVDLSYSPRSIPKRDGEIRLFAVLRNESLRLPYWLEHYRRLGVARFFIVDNGSSDSTSSILQRQPDVHSFFTDQGFQDSQSGRLWLAELMELYGIGHWCVVADGDELLAYPYWEGKSLHCLSDVLDAEGSEALQCLLLDMYAEGPIRATHYRVGTNPFDLCPYFDPDFEPMEGSIAHGSQKYAIPTFVGGTRHKVFGVRAYLSKIGMLRYKPGMLLTRGQHGVVGARISNSRGVMFHFKFFSDFVQKTLDVVRRGERDNCSREWRTYAEALRRDPSLTLYDRRSVALQGTSQLIRLGIMKSTTAYDTTVGRTE